MNKESLIERLRGYKSTPRHCEELCYEAANEIESLLKQLSDMSSHIMCDKNPVAYMAVDSQGGSLFFRNEVLIIKTVPLYIALDQK